MNVRIFMAIGLLPLAAMFARADIYVDAEADPSSADGTEEHPYATIQAAVNAASAGTTIRIAEGVYDQGGTDSSRVKIDGKALHLIGAGRGKTVIVGASGEEADGRGAGAWRCVYVNWGHGTIIEGVTLKDGATIKPDYSRYASRSGGGLLVVGGNGSDPRNVYVVDSEFIGCKAVYGGGAKGGTLVRCFFDGCYADAGLAASDSCMVNCVVTRSRRAGHLSDDGVVELSSLYNCTLVDNDAYYAIVNSTDANGSVIAFSSTLVDSKNSTASASVIGSSVALIAPAFDDWRPIAGSAAIGVVDVSSLSGLSLPAGVDALVDFTGAAIVASEGFINAGAIQESATAAAGGLLFETGNISAPLVIGGRTNAFVNKTCVFPESYPTQYVVSAVAGDNAICRLARRGQSRNGSNHNVLLGFAPRLDDTLCLLPPPDAGTVATNFFEFASSGNVKWTDPVNGSDSNPGTEAEPYKTLKAAVESIPSSYTTDGGHYVIYAKKGVYDEGVMTSSYTYGDFRLVVEAGAFGRLRIVAADGPEETFIVGAPNTPGTAGSVDGCGASAIRGVYITGRCDVSLQGFTITGCYSLSQYNSHKYGAAVYSYNNGDETLRAQITDCIISNNFAFKSIVCGGLLKRCRIENNTSKETIFSGRDGDSMTVNNDNGTAAFCVFANNTLTEPSATQGLIGGAARVYNSTVVGTSSSGRVTGGKTGVSLNTIYFGGETVYGASTLENCVIWGCADTSAVTGDNVVDNPLFKARNDGDYRVGKSSPCVGYAAALNEDAYFWKVFDGAMDGALVFKNGRAVVGAYQKTVRVVIPGLCVIIK